MPMSKHLLTLASYHLWATERLLDAVQALSDSDYRREVGLFFHSIHGTLNHLLVAEHQLWWLRLSNGQSPHVQLDAIVHEDRGMVDVQLRSLSARWHNWIASVDEARWAEELHYTTLRGTEVHVPLAATLAHVFNHATHHRGQITAALTALGQPAPELDLIYYLQAKPSHAQHREAVLPSDSTTFP